MKNLRIQMFTQILVYTTVALFSACSLLAELEEELTKEEPTQEEQPQGFITGTITDNSIGTSGDYKVVIATSNWYMSAPVASTTLSAAGSFVINDLVPEGNYYIMAYRDMDADGNYTRIGAELDPMGEYSTTAVNITSAGLKGVDIQITPRSISGAITGAPAGWKVKAKPSSASNGIDELQSDINADGTYSLTLYREAPYNVTAYDPAGSASAGFSNNPVDLRGVNTSATGIDISVPMVTITGTIIDNSIGTSGDYKVVVATSNWYMSAPVASTTQSVPGAYTISAVIPEGSYYIMVYRDMDVNGSYTRTGATLDPMAEYSTTATALTTAGLNGVDMTITPRSISGAITGVPAGWKVKAKPSSASNGIDELQSDINADGTYSLTLYREASYNVTTYDPAGSASAGYSNNPVDLRGANTSATGIDMSVPMVTITGTITDNSVGTSGDYKVVIATSNWYMSAPVAATTLNAPGAYTISAPMSEGSYYIMVYRDMDANGSYTRTGAILDPMAEYSTATTSLTAAGLNGVDMTITPRSISGTITGAPAGWKVKAKPSSASNGIDELQIDINADGSYFFTLYREASYNVTAYHPAGAASVTYQLNPVDLRGANTTATGIDFSIQ